MAEHDEETKKKVESDDGSKKKKKEPKKSKKEDGHDETNELTAEGKDKKKAKSKKEKSEAAPLDESKSPKPKKGKKLASSDHEVKDDKITERKKKEDREPGHYEKAEGETALKSDAQAKAKKKKGVTAETSEEENGQAESHAEPPSTDAPPVQAKTKTKKSKKAVSDDDSIPKSKDTEETVDGETTLKDAPSAQPKIKQRKTKKHIMAESSDDELEIKSDDFRKKKGKKHDLTANDEETEAKTKVKKGKKKHTASELSGENAENTKKKKKKRSENLGVADSLTDNATMEPSAQSKKTTPLFSLPTTARALDDPTFQSDKNEKSNVAADTTVHSGSHVVKSRPADNENSPSDIPTIFEKETPDEKPSFIAETEKGADQMIGESTENKGASDDQNLTQEVNEVQSPNKPPEDPSADIVVGDAMTANDSIVAHHKGTVEGVETPGVTHEDTETKANSASHLAETNASGVEASASGNPESTEGGEVLLDVVPSLVTENDGSIKQEVPQPATELTISDDEVKESQSHDALPEGVELTSTETAPVTEATNLEETSHQVESHVEASESETAVAAGNMDILVVPSESNTNGQEEGADVSETKIMVDAVLQDTTKSIEVTVEHISQDIQVQHTDPQVPSDIDTPEEPNDEAPSRTALAPVVPDVIAPVNNVEKDSLEHAETTGIIVMPTEPEREEIEMPRQTSNQVTDDGSPSLEAPTGTIDSQEPNIPYNVEVLDSTIVLEETSTIEAAADANNEDVQREHHDSQGKVEFLSMTATDMGKGLGDDETGPKEVVVAEVQGTQTDDSEKVEESLVQANPDEMTEQVGDTVEIKEAGKEKTTERSENAKIFDLRAANSSERPKLATITLDVGDLEPTTEDPALEINNVVCSSESSILISESPNELLAVCEAMTGLVKNDESSSKEMNRLKEKLLVLFSAMHEERISLHARLQKQEAELLKSEEKIEVLEEEMEKQLADWDVLEVKLGQADLEIRKLLAENQRLGNELEVVSKADSNGDPSDFSSTKGTKNFSDDIATAKSELEEP